MKEKILILGKGFIGNRLQEELGCAISDKLIYSYKEAEEEVLKFGPQVMINCIGHVGANVDECEKDLNNTLLANTFIPIMLAEVAIRHNIRLIHISSGCIFHYDYDKDKPIEETKDPDYLELFYSRSKIYSDRALEVLSKKHPILIIRIRVPLDNRPHHRNILTKLISYKKVIDIPNSITYIPDFIQALKHLIAINAYGIYNIVNKNPLKYQKLMEAYKKYVPDFKFETIPYNKLNIIRTNVVLSVEKLEKSGFKIRDIHEVLEECVQEYLKYS